MVGWFTQTPGLGEATDGRDVCGGETRPPVVVAMPLVEASTPEIRSDPSGKERKSRRGNPSQIFTSGGRCTWACGHVGMWACGHGRACVFSSARNTLLCHAR